MNSKGLAARIFGSVFLLASTVTIVKVNEGYKEVAYQDGAGVWTICYGETKGVKKGDVRTKEECESQLWSSLKTHSQALDGLPDTTPDVVALGSLDMAYNIGVGGFNNSTIKRELMKGNYKRAGEAVLSWRFITITQNGKRVKFDCSTKGNKICYGLWKRRLVQSEMIGDSITIEQAIAKLKGL